MIRNIAVRLLIAAALALPPLAQAVDGPITVTDDAGRRLTLPRPPRRIISLAPSLTELLYTAGGGDRLVATVEFSDHPPAARQLPRVGTNERLDLERIAVLRPDLILIWRHGNPQRAVDQLTALRIPLYYLEPRRIDDIPLAVERLGRLVGTERPAAAAARAFRDRLAALRRRYAEVVRVPVFYQVWATPLMTINADHLISDVLQLCGGDNLFGSQPMLVPQLSTESVVAANPRAILTARMSAGSADILPQRQPEADVFRIWRRFTSMRAVREGQMWTIPGDTISRPGPRILDGAQAVCGALDGARRRAN